MIGPDERVPHELVLAYAENPMQPTSVRQMARELIERRRQDIKHEPCTCWRYQPGSLIGVWICPQHGYKW